MQIIAYEENARKAKIMNNNKHDVTSRAENRFCDFLSGIFMCELICKLNLAQSQSFIM